ncbi:hypothetical protein [Streptomyces sp. NPDC018059]|uniref:hypothetical protein n=1 Tax=Streptomyces sp. NPDC018059 TaxID=3365041 RepID=UPI0037955DC7
MPHLREAVVAEAPLNICEENVEQLGELRLLVRGEPADQLRLPARYLVHGGFDEVVPGLRQRDLDGPGPPP